jgi:hypothetical protein
MPIGPMLASASGPERRARDATPNDNRSLPPSHSSARWPCAECPIPAPNDRRRREGAAAQPEAEPLPSPRPRPRPRTTRVPSPSPESAIAHVMRHARPFGMRILFLPVSRRPSHLSAKRLNIGSSDGAAYAGMHAHGSLLCQQAGVGCWSAGPGSDLSEESAAGVGLAALDFRVAPECPPGPASRCRSASAVSCR